MSDPILEKAKARREAAAREVAEWDAFITRYLDLAGRPVGTTGIHPSVSQARPIPPDSELGKTIAMVDAVLDEAGHPVQLVPLYDEVTRRGLHIGGKKPAYTLSARLSNSGRYISTRESGWWFKSRPVPLSRVPASNNNPPSEPETPRDTGSAKGGGALLMPPNSLSASVSSVALLSSMEGTRVN